MGGEWILLLFPMGWRKVVVAMVERWTGGKGSMGRHRCILVRNMLTQD